MQQLAPHRAPALIPRGGGEGRAAPAAAGGGRPARVRRGDGGAGGD